MIGRDALILAFAALCSLSIMTWIVWSERPVPTPVLDERAPAPAPELAAAPPSLEPQAVDEARVDTLEAAAASSPDDASPRAALGDLYFGAQRFTEAIPWYEEALALTPANADIGTNLGVSYYYAGQTERAIETFERSLEAEPSHQRALLSLGIVRAFGLQDLEGAIAAWEQVVAIAPETPEAAAAQDSLDRIRSAHSSSDAAPQ